MPLHMHIFCHASLLQRTCHAAKPLSAQSASNTAYCQLLGNWSPLQGNITRSHVQRPITGLSVCCSYSRIRPFQRCMPSQESSQGVAHTKAHPTCSKSMQEYAQTFCNSADAHFQVLQAPCQCLRLASKGMVELLEEALSHARRPHLLSGPHAGLAQGSVKEP